MELDYKALEAKVEHELNDILKQPSISGPDLDKMIKATCLIDQLEGMKEKKEYSELNRGGSYGRMMDRSYDSRNYSMMEPHFDHYGNMSYERGRSPRTGQYVSRGNYYGEGEYSSHSIADRMVAKLEEMYDDAKTPHEKELVDTWIRKIRMGQQ